MKYTQNTHPEMYPMLSDRYFWTFDPDKENGPNQWMYRIQIDDPDRNYHISSHGMSVEYADGTATTSNVTPCTLFPDSENGLTDKQLNQLINMPLEGMGQSKKEVDALYKRYLKEQDEN